MLLNHPRNVSYEPLDYRQARVLVPDTTSDLRLGEMYCRNESHEHLLVGCHLLVLSCLARGARLLGTADTAAALDLFRTVHTGGPTAKKFTVEANCKIGLRLPESDDRYNCLTLTFTDSKLKSTLRVT